MGQSQSNTKKTSTESQFTCADLDEDEIDLKETLLEEDPAATNKPLLLIDPPKKVFEINDLLTEIVKNLANNDNDQQALSSSIRLFRQETTLPRITRKLGQLTAHGNEDKVKQFFDLSPLHNIRYLCERDVLTDPGGRMFTSISSFQYAVWSLDSHMWKMMLTRLQVAADTENGYEATERVRLELLDQYNEVLGRGLVYELDNEGFKEKCFSFQPLLRALFIYINQSVSLGWEDRKVLWINTVGKQQRHIPAHVAQEYCRLLTTVTPTGKYQARTFTEAYLPRNLMYYDYFLQPPWESWWNSAKLGISLGIIGTPIGPIMAGAGVDGGGVFDAAKYDLKALRTLESVRTDELLELKEHLSTPLKKQPPISPSTANKL